MGGKTGQVRFETSRNQLVGAVYPDGSSEEFAYDLVGNRTSLVAVSTNGTTNTIFYTYASGNRLVADASETATNAYAYDGAGRLTNHVVNGQPRTFTYNFQGRMISLTDIDGSVFAYEFDGEGNRLSQSLNDCLSKRFVYDGADVLLELNPTNGVAYAWVNGPGIDQPIERLLFIDGTPRARRVFHADALGSIAALTDPGGAVVQTYAYAAFGSIRSSSGFELNRATYTAREQLGDSQRWMYYRHRIYSAQSGRFSIKDPIGFVGGNNIWVYLENNPLIFRDVWGLRTEWFPTGEDVPMGAVFGWWPEPNDSLVNALSGLGKTTVDVVGKVWALPNTALGLLCGGVSMFWGGTVDFGHNAIQFHTRLFPDSGALTLGNVTLYSGGWGPETPWDGYNPLPCVVETGFHEECHTYQSQILGIFFLPVYFAAGGISGDNPLEEAADIFSLEMKFGGNWHK